MSAWQQSWMLSREHFILSLCIHVSSNLCICNVSVRDKTHTVTLLQSVDLHKSPDKLVVVVDCCMRVHDTRWSFLFDQGRTLNSRLNSLFLVFPGAIDCDLGPWPTLWARPLRARPTASPRPLSIASLVWKCPSLLAACWTETSPPSRTPSVSSSMRWTGTGWR